MIMISKTPKIAVIGLGYVGLPLAVEFGKQFTTVAFDIDEIRVNELEQNVDRTGEVTAQEIIASSQLMFTSAVEKISDCDVFVVAVPTPIDSENRPNLSYLEAASSLVGEVIKKGGLVVFESTVFPGATEEECVPKIEHVSGLTLNLDFFVGYSPERINPGDRTRRLADIRKIVAGSTIEAADYVEWLYGKIIKAGTHRAPSIKVAEAAKVVENTQRDMNIALINELAIIFHQLGIDTHSVLEAAETKWNFLPFYPGLVGGHCIGVDPYYLTYKSVRAGYSPEVILAGRKINDGMGAYVVSRVVRLMINHKIHVKEANVLILGVAFKEDCSDTRNSRIIDIIKGLESYGAHVDTYDPCVNQADVQSEHDIVLLERLPLRKYSLIVVAVAHQQLREFAMEDVAKLKADRAVVFDVKRVWPDEFVDERL
jgi:UDP-N-acetyl-D-glucosamine/UDP-N-acetyl-D-galactosamine dehydrogenase